MKLKTIHKGLRIPKDLVLWLKMRCRETKRTFSAEVIYQLYQRMEGGEDD